MIEINFCEKLARQIEISRALPIYSLIKTAILGPSISSARRPRDQA